jgi:hypothetical protein
MRVTKAQITKYKSVTRMARRRQPTIPRATKPTRHAAIIGAESSWSRKVLLPRRDGQVTRKTAYSIRPVPCSRPAATNRLVLSHA